MPLLFRDGKMIFREGNAVFVDEGQAAECECCGCELLWDLGSSVNLTIAGASQCPDQCFAVGDGGSFDNFTSTPIDGTRNLNVRISPSGTWQTQDGSHSRLSYGTNETCSGEGAELGTSWVFRVNVGVDCRVNYIAVFQSKLLAFYYEAAVHGGEYYLGNEIPNQLTICAENGDIQGGSGAEVAVFTGGTAILTKP